MTITETVIKAAGGSPNEAWLRTGQALVVVGVMSYAGINGYGLHIEPSADIYSPLVMLSAGFMAMSYGTNLKKRLAIAKERHDLAMIAAAKPKSEPTKGLLAFLEWFATLDHPVTLKELNAVPFGHDESKEPIDVAESLKGLRAEWWVMSGEITKYGNTYTLREK
jgi:hypothetical protein